jgi:hypothetical protein
MSLTAIVEFHRSSGSSIPALSWRSGIVHQNVTPAEVIISHSNSAATDSAAETSTSCHRLPDVR